MHQESIFGGAVGEGGLNLAIRQSSFLTIKIHTCTCMAILYQTTKYKVPQR